MTFIKKNIRIIFFMLLTFAISGLIIWRYSLIMIFNSDRVSPSSPLPPLIQRGFILDRNGEPLATQTLQNSVEAWIPYIADKEETARVLSGILNMNYERLLSDFEKHDANLWIKRKITQSESKKIEFYIDNGKLPGIRLIPEYGRIYPQKELGAHIVGFAGIDNRGLAGIEYTFDSELYPEGRKDKVVKGNQIFLTIDSNVQYFAQNIAETAYLAHKADSVMILVMKAKTGEILGYTSIPGFDSNKYSKSSKSEKKNRPISMGYEPGSVFKIFSIASALQTGAVTKDDKFFCNGLYEKILSPDYTIRIHCLGHHGEVTPQKIIQTSCNAGMAYISDNMSKKSFYNMLKYFEFGTPTGLPLPGETNGILREPKKWSVRSKPMIAMGQEILVSTIQMIKAATVFANKGILLRPRIINKIVSPGGKVLKQYYREPIRRVLSEYNARLVLEMMETATYEHGTAKRAKLDGIRISAKTGTAEIWDPKTGRYSSSAVTASCLAIFPTDDPQIIIYVVIRNPKTREIYGGRIATPIVKDLSELIIDYLGIPRKTDTIINHSGKIKLGKSEKISLKYRIPDFTGLSKRELLSLLRYSDIKVILKGSGWVVSQAPKPGTRIKKGMTITLELR